MDFEHAQTGDGDKPKAKPKDQLRLREGQHQAQIARAAAQHRRRRNHPRRDDGQPHEDRKPMRAQPLFDEGNLPRRFGQAHREFRVRQGRRGRDQPGRDKGQGRPDARFGRDRAHEHIDPRADHHAHPVGGEQHRTEAALETVRHVLPPLPEVPAVLNRTIETITTSINPIATA